MKRRTQFDVIFVVVFFKNMSLKLLDYETKTKTKNKYTHTHNFIYLKGFFIDSYCFNVNFILI